MPNRPIINIDLNADAFNRFKASFDEYAERVEEVNKVWSTSKVFGDATALKPLSDYAEGVANSFHRMQGALHTAHHGLSTFARGAEGILHTVEGVTKGLVKWGAILAGGTLFGIDRLAGSVFDRSRSAAGIGVSVGTQSAFNVNMSRYVDSPSGLLAKAADIQQDRSQWHVLAGMGLLNQRSLSESPAALAGQMMHKAAEFWRRTPDLQLARAFGYSDVFNPSDLRRLGAAGSEGVDRALARSRQDTTSLGYGKKAQEGWVQLAIQQHRAGLQLEAIFGKGLAPLAPNLVKLSDATVKLTGAFVDAPAIKGGIDHLAGWLGGAAAEMQSSGFKKAMTDYVDSIGTASKDILALVAPLAKWAEEHPKTAAALGIAGIAMTQGDGGGGSGGIASGAAGAGTVLAGRAIARGAAGVLGSGVGAAVVAPLALSGDTPRGVQHPATGPGFWGQHGTAEQWIDHAASSVWGATTRMFGIPSAHAAPMPGFAPLAHGGALGNALARGESGAAGYNAYNTGAAGVHGAPIDFSQMTVGDVLARQALPQGDSHRLFAVGKYQAIPATLRNAVKALGISPSAKFTPELQERIFRDYLIGAKNPAIHDYITGKSNDWVKAGIATASEWASVDDPMTGRTHYGGIAGYRARGSITASQIHRALDVDRAAFARSAAKLRSQWGPTANSNTQGAAPALAAGGGLAEAFQREFRALRQDIRKHAVKLDVHNSTAAQVAISAANLAPK